MKKTFLFAGLFTFLLFSMSFISALTIEPWQADFDRDGDTDAVDLWRIRICDNLTSEDEKWTNNCTYFDYDSNDKIDDTDIDKIRLVYRKPYIQNLDEPFSNSFYDFNFDGAITGLDLSGLKKYQQIQIDDLKKFLSENTRVTEEIKVYDLNNDSVINGLDIPHLKKIHAFEKEKLTQLMNQEKQKINSTQVFSNETDNGIDIYRKGTNQDNFHGYTRTFEDSCGLEIDGEYNPNILIEFYYENDEIQSEEIECKTSCLNGTCIPDTTNVEKPVELSEIKPTSEQKSETNTISQFKEKQKKETEQFKKELQNPKPSEKPKEKHDYNNDSTINGLDIPSFKEEQKEQTEKFKEEISNKSFIDSLTENLKQIISQIFN